MSNSNDYPLDKPNANESVKPNAKGKPPQYTPDEFITACQKAFGVKGNVVRAIGCTYATFERYLENYPDIKVAFEDSKKELITVSESVIVRGVSSADLPLAVSTAKFVLSRRSLDWKDKQAVDLDANVTVELTESMRTEGKRLAKLALENPEPLKPKASTKA